MDALAAIGEGGCTREYLSDVLDVCRCPLCRNSLRWRDGSEAVGPAQTPSLECEGCGNAYPFRDGIIEFIPPDVSLEPTAESVRRFYDEFGWQVDPTSGHYNDSVLFAGDSASSRYYEIYSHLSFLENFGGGKFILDAACGPIAHQEYLVYSLGYKYQVCADISLTALKEARRRVGANGIYCLCSLVSLPFAPDAFGAVISGYTVQHIRDEDQRKAIFELVRVLSPGGTLSIMTAVDLAFQRLLGRTRRVMKRFLPRRRQEGDALLATNDRSPNLHSALRARAGGEGRRRALAAGICPFAYPAYGYSMQRIFND